MKDKDVKDEQLERIDNELYAPVDLGDESIGGGTVTNTYMPTFTPNGRDDMMDLDFWFDE